MLISASTKQRILLIVVLFLAAFLSETLSAETSIKIRAREHFDTVWIQHKNLNREYSYAGIGPNINVWLENPYWFSVGLSYSVLFINSSVEPAAPDFGEDMDLTKIGIESKIYFDPGEGGPFARIGLSSNSLNTKGSAGKINGIGTYLGFGWEIKFSKIGLAFEAAGRRIELDRNIRIDTYSPSIGVHFYGYI